MESKRKVRYNRLIERKKHLEIKKELIKIHLSNTKVFEYFLRKRLLYRLETINYLIDRINQKMSV